jgi:imidazolonepropionase-like amidohydrolase
MCGFFSNPWRARAGQPGGVRQSFWMLRRASVAAAAAGSGLVVAAAIPLGSEATPATLPLVGEAPTATLVIHGGTVIDGTTAAPRRADVVVDGDRITAVTTECGHPAGARLLDVTGMFVLPGFVDMHAHLLEHGRDENGHIPPRVDWSLVRRNLALLLRHGVTTVRDPGAETEAAVTLRGMLEEGRVAGPRVRTAGRILNASSFDPEPFQPVRTAADVRREVRWQHAAGVDFVKLYGSTPPELVRVAVTEAHALGLRVIGHLQRTSWAEAARLGVDQLAHGASWSPDLLPPEAREGYEQTLFGRVYWLEHLDLPGPEVAGTLAELARRGVVVDPTLIAYHTKFFGNDPRWLASPALGLVPAKLVAGWRAGSFTRDWSPEQFAAAQRAWPRMLALTRAMVEAGVRLVVGTDMPTPWIVPGASFHEELTLLRDAGIPEAAILRMATAEGARALGLGAEVGTIRPGLRADLVVLRSDPLRRIENTRAIAAVVQRGRLVDLEGALENEE